MQELLTFAHGFPRRELVPDERLLVDGQPVDALYVLLEGRLRIEKAGVQIAVVGDPGACVGEMSLLLGAAATADVTAIAPSAVAVIEHAQPMLETEPGLALALGRLLALRLQTMTTYLVDIKHQYADHEGGLGMVDVVLGSLLQGGGARSSLSSDRDPEPEY